MKIQFEKDWRSHAKGSEAQLPGGIADVLLRRKFAVLVTEAVKDAPKKKAAGKPNQK